MKGACTTPEGRALAAAALAFHGRLRAAWHPRAFFAFLAREPQHFGASSRNDLAGMMDLSRWWKARTGALPSLWSRSHSLVEIRPLLAEAAGRELIDQPELFRAV